MHRTILSLVACLVLGGVSKKLGEWYQKTNKTEDTNKLTLLAFKIIAILQNTLLVTFIKLLETVSQIRGVGWVDFFLFPSLKSIMKGTHFADVAAIQENVTVIL
jgi:hypothetical protein